MKIGDTVPVELQGHVVADAVITAIDGSEATIDIPATRVVMGVRMSLDPDAGRAAPEVDRSMVRIDETADDTPSVAAQAVAQNSESLRTQPLDSSALD